MTENIYERCREDGMNDCVCKPVDRDKLFNCLAREFEAQMRLDGIDPGREIKADPDVSAEGSPAETRAPEKAAPEEENAGKGGEEVPVSEKSAILSENNSEQEA